MSIVSLDGIDRNLESGAHLGCTPWQTFREVTLPLSLPGLGAGSLLVLRAGRRQLRHARGCWAAPTPCSIPSRSTTSVIGQLDWPTGSVLSLILLIVPRPSWSPSTTAS